MVVVHNFFDHKMQKINKDTPLRLRRLKIANPVALAPMVALSHSATRTLIQECGGVGLLYTEMLSVRRLPSETAEHCPLLVTTAAEQPLFYQLAGSEPERLPAAIAKVHALGGAGIDLNLGCPAPQIRRMGAGAALVGNREKLTAMLRILRKETELPISVKIRLTDPKQDTFSSFCKMLEDEGVDLITVHARRPGEKFCRKPDWSAVATGKSAVSIPVFVNGGIFSVDDALRALQQSHADGVMVGRGALIRPWLCQEIEEALLGRAVPITYRKDLVYFRFIALVRERFQERHQLVRLKYFTKYFSKLFPFGHGFYAKIQKSRNMQEAEEQARIFFS